MKNGLTTCARVEELICVMQKLNCVTNNVGDAARQWSTAASTFACTQNRECLSLFVHLNVLGFLNHWLQDPVRCSSDVGDGEELINTLIGSLDKLPTNPEKLSSSAIFVSIEKLFGHTNVNIKGYSPSDHASRDMRLIFSFLLQSSGNFPFWAKDPIPKSYLVEEGLLRFKVNTGRVKLMVAETLDLGGGEGVRERHGHPL